MSFWNESGAPHPWGPFDPDAELAFSFDFAAFAAAAGPALTVSSVTPLADPALEVVATGLLAGVYTLRLKRSAETLPAGKRDLPFTLRVTLSDGQHDDRTFILRLTDR